MNQEYIERIWEEAKLLFLHENENLITTLITLAYSDGIDAEREACAKVCDKVKTECEEGGVRFTTARTCAKRIRARGEI